MAAETLVANSVQAALAIYVTQRATATNDPA
jgi:hypothetical protein